MIFIIRTQLSAASQPAFHHDDADQRLDGRLVESICLRLCKVLLIKFRSTASEPVDASCRTWIAMTQARFRVESE